MLSRIPIGLLYKIAKRLTVFWITVEVINAGIKNPTLKDMLHNEWYSLTLMCKLDAIIMCWNSLAKKSTEFYFGSAAKRNHP